MSKSKNDIPVAGGTIRQTIRPVRGKYDVIINIMNLNTGKPYTNEELAADLELRKREYPQLASLVEPKLDRIAAKPPSRPDSDFSLQHPGVTKEIAKKEMQELLFPRICTLMHLLYRPLFESNLQKGELKVADFVLYQEDMLYMGELPDTRTRLLGCLKSTILPVIDDYKLKELDKTEQEKALRRIERNLRGEGAKPSRRGYVQRAYRGLIQAIESSGWTGCSSGIRLVELISRLQKRNAKLLSSARPHCLDKAQRDCLFRMLEQPDRSYEYLLIALIYAGMDPAEIAAACFGDFDVLTFGDQHCYTLTITRRIRKLNKRHSTVSATNDAFPFQKFRRIVLPPWAGEVLERWLDHLRSLGLSDDQIRKMHLSSEATDGTFESPDEIKTHLKTLLQQAGIGDTYITRTRAGGSLYRDIIPADVQLLQRDAQYLAECCGANRVMLHSMFGIAWTETDEQAYVDLLSDAYAVTRYLRLRRWSPHSAGPLSDAGAECLTGYADVPARHILQVHNPTDHPITLTLSSNYAFRGYWKAKKARN